MTAYSVALRIALGMLLTSTALLVFTLLLLIRSAATETSQSVSVSDAPPSAGVVTISTTSQGTSAQEITLTENSTRTVYIYGIASDENGCDEINAASNYSVRFYRSTVSGGAQCNPDGRNCYIVPVASDDLGKTNACTGGSDMEISYEFTVQVKHYADATDMGSSPDRGDAHWIARVVVTDKHGFQSNPSVATTNINTLIALNVESTIDYGTLVLGGTSLEQAMSVNNTGNKDGLDYSVYDSTGGWTCTTGTFGADRVRFNTTSSQGYGAGTSMPSNASSAHVVNAGISKASDSGPAAQSTYFTLRVPDDDDLSGVCSSMLTFTAL